MPEADSGQPYGRERSGSRVSHGLCPPAHILISALGCHVDGTSGAGSAGAPIQMDGFGLGGSSTSSCGGSFGLKPKLSSILVGGSNTQGATGAMGLPQPLSSSAFAAAMRAPSFSPTGALPVDRLQCGGHPRLSQHRSGRACRWWVEKARLLRLSNHVFVRNFVRRSTIWTGKLLEYLASPRGLEPLLPP